MKTLYIDCGMGAAGDMLTAALLELLPEDERCEFIHKLNQVGIPKVTVSAEEAVKCGITGTHVSVLVDGVEEDEHMHDHHHEHDHEHHHDHEHSHDHDHSHEHAHEHSHDHAHTHSHTSMHSIEHIVRDHLKVSDKVKEDILSVYNLIAEAESKAHGKPVSEIHFHEVGTMDAVADVTAVCMLLEELGVERVVASPVHVGSGTVKCAHGVLPVPAPATAHILKGCPIYGGKINGELCTPTGAALLKHFVGEFGEMPVMTTEAIGYGMGKKDFEVANCVRVMLGETASNTGKIVMLSCNVDDMTAEEIGFAMDAILGAGAREVFTEAINMKKNRPGTLITVICDEGNSEDMARVIFTNTTTLGIRKQLVGRYVLNRKIEEVSTEFGVIRKKISEGYGVHREKYEYDDLARIAKEQGLSLLELKNRL